MDSVPVNVNGIIPDDKHIEIEYTHIFKQVLKSSV